MFPILGDIVESNGVAMYLESPGFHEDSILHIVNMDSADLTEYVMPESVATSLFGDPELKRLSLRMVDRIDDCRRDLNTPRDLPWCTSSRYRGNTIHEVFLRNDENPSITQVGLPVIRWEPMGEGSRWNIQLLGSDTVLDYAAWDDTSRIMELAERLKDPESLLIMMALVDSSEAKLLTAKMETYNLFQSKLIPEMYSDPIREKIVENDLLSLDLANISARGELCVVRIAIATIGDNVPVAIGVRPPSKSSLTEILERIHFTIHSDGSFDERHSIERFNAAQAELDERSVIEWGTRFRSILTETGWNEVEFVIPSERESQIAPNWIWITKLPLDHWNLIAPAANADMINAANIMDLRTPKRERF